MLSEKARDEFKRIWEAEYGEKISDELAVSEGINLLSLFDVIYRPIKRDWVEGLDVPEVH